MGIPSLRSRIQRDAYFYKQTGLTVKEVLLSSEAFYQLATQGQLVLGLGVHFLRNTSIQVKTWKTSPQWVRAYRFQEALVPLFLIPGDAP